LTEKTSPVRRLTHSGKAIASLRTQWDIAREMMQETVEALVFGLLALSMGLDGEQHGQDLYGVALLAGMILGCFCLSRLVVICELFGRLMDIEN
jgi:hypothetical protein